MGIYNKVFPSGTDCATFVAIFAQSSGLPIVGDFTSVWDISRGMDYAVDLADSEGSLELIRDPSNEELDTPDNVPSETLLPAEDATEGPAADEPLDYPPNPELTDMEAPQESDQGDSTDRADATSANVDSVAEPPPPSSPAEEGTRPSSRPSTKTRPVTATEKTRPSSRAGAKTRPASAVLDKEPLVEKTRISTKSRPTSTKLVSDSGRLSTKTRPTTAKTVTETGEEKTQMTKSRPITAKISNEAIEEITRPSTKTRPTSANSASQSVTEQERLSTTKSRPASAKSAEGPAVEEISRPSSKTRPTSARSSEAIAEKTRPSSGASTKTRPASTTAVGEVEEAAASQQPNAEQAAELENSMSEGVLLSDSAKPSLEPQVAAEETQSVEVAVDFPEVQAAAESQGETAMVDAGLTMHSDNEQQLNIATANNAAVETLLPEPTSNELDTVPRPEPSNVESFLSNEKGDELKPASESSIESSSPLQPTVTENDDHVPQSNQQEPAQSEAKQETADTPTSLPHSLPPAEESPPNPVAAASLPSPPSAPSKPEETQEEEKKDDDYNSNAFKLFRTTLRINSIARTIKKRSRTPSVSTALPTANYGTSFAKPLDSGSAEEQILIPAGTHLPANLHLADKPSIASPHVMAPIDRNILMGRRVVASETSNNGAAENVPKPNMANRGSRTRQGSFDNRRRSSAASFVFNQTNEATEERTAVGAHNEEEGEGVKEVVEGKGGVKPLPPQPVTRIDIIRRLLPDRGLDPEKSVEMEMADAKSVKESELPMLNVHFESQDKIIEDLEKETTIVEKDYSALPQKPIHTVEKPVVLKPSMIPRPSTRQVPVEVVSITLDALGNANTVEEVVSGTGEEKAKEDMVADTTTAQTKENSKPYKLRKNLKVEHKHHVTVLTKSGLKVEVRDEPPPLGAELKGILPSSTAKIRSSSGQQRPRLPLVSTRPVTSYLKEHLGMTRYITSTTIHASSLDNCMSPYSYPLPIKREVVPAHKEPFIHHRLLQQLRSQRETEIQAEYLGTGSRLASQHFFDELLIMDGETVEKLVTGQVTQSLAPTFNSVLPSHLIYTELGRVHWQEVGGLDKQGSYFGRTAFSVRDMPQPQVPRTPRKISSRFRNQKTPASREVQSAEQRAPKKASVPEKTPQHTAATIQLEMITKSLRSSAANTPAHSKPTTANHDVDSSSTSAARLEARRKARSNGFNFLPELAPTHEYRAKTPRVYKAIPQFGDDPNSLLMTAPQVSNQLFVEEVV
ncbi:hypothetical protein HDV05_004531 [Chytridiales sp. JEL 0842]|nr:hypothetical protein HDV05_004531 [Chytridiales sp. JEL 0842]